MVVKVALFGPMIVTKEVKSRNLIYHRDVSADVQTAFYSQTNDILLRFISTTLRETFVQNDVLYIGQRTLSNFVDVKVL